MSLASNVIVGSFFVIVLACSGPAAGEDQAGDANSDTTQEMTSAPPEVIASANFEASIVLYKELDPANASGYDALYKKGLETSGLGASNASAHPKYAELKSGNLTLKREQVKEPAMADYAKTSCLIILKQK